VRTTIVPAPGRVALIRTRILVPSCALVGVNLALVALAILLPSASHRYVSETDDGVHDPWVTLRTFPTVAVPLILGAARLSIVGVGVGVAVGAGVGVGVAV
jgi:hypothetical protein